MKKVLKFLFFCFIFSTASSQVYADTLSHFHFVVGEGGTLNNSFLPAEGAYEITGTGLKITSLSLTPSGGSEIIYQDVNAELDFYAKYNSLTPTGYMTINGGINGIDSTDDSPLLAGSLVHNVVLGPLGLSFHIGNAWLNDGIDNILGLPIDSEYDNTVLTISFKNLKGNPFGNFTADVTGESVDGRHAPVPIPAAAWLFLTGIAGIAGLRRKNKR